MICRDCHEDFNQKTIKRGFKDQCDDCSMNQDEPPMALGFNDGSLNKGTSISIYNGDNPKIRKMISNQRSRTGGF